MALLSDFRMTVQKKKNDSVYRNNNDLIVNGIQYRVKKNSYHNQLL